MGVKLIVINSSNYVENSGNTYIYKLPQTMKFSKKSKVGVASLSMYNSTFNISASRGNNKLTFTFPSATPQTLNITFDDGYYSIDQMNYYVQSKMYENKMYVTNGINTYYFFEIVQNAVRYAVQLNSFYLPTLAQATTLNYVQPAGATWSYPASNRTPQLTFNDSFGNLIGFEGQTYPATVQTTNQSIDSTKTPNISPVDSYILTCNLINSKYSIPSNVLVSLPLNGAIGTLLVYNPPEIVYSSIAPNVYGNIVIQFYDQLFNRLEIKDKELVLTIAIDDEAEEQ